VCREAAQIIVHARKDVTVEKVIQKFSETTIELNFAAHCYYYHFGWTSCITTPTPIKSSTSDEGLLTAVELGPVPIL